jgi:hypothetical protein
LLKGVVGHQSQDQIKAPILFGSLSTELLSKGMKHAKNILPSDVLQHFSYSHLNSDENYKFSKLNSLLHADAEEDSHGSLPHVDSAPGLVKNLPLSTLGLEPAVDVVACPLPLGNLQPPGASQLAGVPAPGAASPLPRCPWSPPVTLPTAAGSAVSSCRNAIGRQGASWQDGSGGCWPPQNRPEARAGPLHAIASDANRGGPQYS